MPINYPVLIFIIILSLWVVSLIQNIQLARLHSKISSIEVNTHILEVELNDIQNEYELILNCLNDNELGITGVNDSNQKRKAILAAV
jgi:hypothetical protein